MSREHIPSSEFYGHYFGHRTDHLESVFNKLVAAPRRNGEKVTVVYLVGDSSFDNKYWLTAGGDGDVCDGDVSRHPKAVDGAGGRRAAVNGYERVLKPPQSIPDVAFHINALAANYKGATKVVCINAAVEESTIDGRKRGMAMLPQDEFVRDHLTSDDVIVVSLGGNDVALKPRTSTIAAMGWLTCCSFESSIKSGSAWGLGSMRSLCCNELSEVIRAYLARATPKAVIPCVIYYPDMNAKSTSWANKILGLIGYNSNPAKVQAIIDDMYRAAKGTLTVSVDPRHTPTHPSSMRVEVLPLSAALNGTDSKDYVARVEPSSQGGSKMADLVWNSVSKILAL